MKFLLKNGLLALCLFLVAAPARAMDAIDVYYGLLSWSMRWGGYRAYRVPVKLASGKKCVIALSAHVNPTVDNYTLLLHGFGDSRFMWWKWIEKYGQNPQYSSFIAVDLPLHGQSDCDSADTWDQVVDVVDKAVRAFGRGPITRLIGQSMGVVPTALLAERYSQAQQIWLTPPLLKPGPLRSLVSDLIGIDSPSKVQVFMNRVLTHPRDFPDFIRGDILERIGRSQVLLRHTDLKTLTPRVLGRAYENLLIVIGGKDQLIPPDEVDPRMARLSPREVAAVACGHDILRECGEEVKGLVEASRYRLDKAKY